MLAILKHDERTPRVYFLQLSHPRNVLSAELLSISVRFSEAFYCYLHSYIIDGCLQL